MFHPTSRPAARFLLPAALCCCLAVGCGGKTPPASKPAAGSADTAAASDTPAVARTVSGADTQAIDTSAVARTDTAEAIPARPPGPRYHAVPIADARSLRRLQRSLGKDAFEAVLKINRIDLQHVRDRDTLVAPDSFTTLLALSPFPQGIPLGDSLAKLLLVSRRVQAYAAYERGRLVRWGPTSTGRQESPTPLGLLHTNWKSRQRTSSFNDEWLLKWYLNLENRTGVSIHEYELPGRPASHACVRLLPDDAEWAFGWADTWALSENRRSVVREGTPVLVFGDWAYGQRPPWKRLPDDPQATTVPEAEIAAALETYAPLLAGLRSAELKESR